MTKFFALSLVCGAMAFAESWNGTIVDTGCKTKDLASHTKKCALGCAKSGFGVVLSDGKFVKFDEAGNAKAVEALKATAKESDLKGKVTGKLDGDVIKVESIEIL
jgi:N-acetyl-beta-hexosaminidase